VDRYTRWVSVFNEQTKQPLYSDFFREQTASSNPTGLLAEWCKRANGIGMLDAMLLTDQMTYLPNDLLVKVDIATMAVSLEARSPFLDHKVIEFAASLPQNLKLRRLTSKYCANCCRPRTSIVGRWGLVFRSGTGSVGRCSRSCARLCCQTKHCGGVC